MNFARLALDNIDRYGEYVFLKYEDREFTNTGLEKLFNRFSRGLQKRGMQKGDRVIVFLPNMPEVLISYQAILRAGAIIVPVNPSLSYHELSYIITDSEASIVITAKGLLETVQAAKEHSPVKPVIITVGTDLPEGFISFEDCYAEDDTFLMFDQPDDAIAIIMYTSGTTGKPKGVMLSHLNIRMEGYGDSQQIGLLDSDGNRILDKVNMIAVLPFCHVYGLCTMGVAYLSGGTVFLMSEFDMEKILNCIQDNQITVFGGVPTMYAWLAIFPGAENYNTSSVVRWISGGSALSLETRQAFEERYNAKVLDAYGLTESTSGFSMQRHDRPIKPGSVGPAIPGSEVRVVDDEGRPLPPGQVGELIIKGPMVMIGYYKNEEETKRVKKDGWLYTGDMAMMDEDGFIYLVDRKKDVIISGGENIYPVQIEDFLHRCEAIKDVAVIGLPDKRLGEISAAIIELKPGFESTTEEDILAFCQALPRYKRPRRIIFDKVPRNPTGKIEKPKLREKYCGGRLVEKQIKS